MPLPQFVYRCVFFRALIVLTLLGVTLPGANASRSQLVCNPRSLSFGKVVDGQSETLPVAITNTGSSSVTVSGVTVSNAAFTVNDFTVPQTLVAGQSVQFSVTFSPTTMGNVSGTVEFSSSVGTVNLFSSGRGVNNWPLNSSPASLNFGSVAVGGSSTQPLTINNPGSSSQTVSIGKLSGTGFSVTGVTLPLILGAGQSFTFSVTFAPQSAGGFSGSILASSPSTPALTVPLSGTGAAAMGQLIITPATLNFGNVTVGQSSNQGGQLTAATAGVTVTATSMSNPAFAISGLTLPVTIPVGQSVNFTVTFTPQSGGVATGALSFASNATNSPTVESLTATGISQQYSVNLAWNQVQQVVGYNVYRSYQSGGPYTRINTSLDSNTAYVDSSVVGGETYYYATTSVNSQGQESSYSNLAQAVIP
jgi:ASPM-SPD-2-Hydin domain-containing protein/HYDIN/CFA65/VesB family protein